MTEARAHHDAEMRKLITQELEGVTPAELVRKALEDIKADEPNYEPSLEMLAHADFKQLEPPMTERGQKSIEAFQAIEITEAGDTGLSDGTLQAATLRAIKNFQLANHLQAQATRLRMEGLHQLYAVTAGTPAEGFLDFLTDMFGLTPPESTPPSAVSSRAGTPLPAASTGSRPPASPAPSSTADDDLQDLLPEDKCVRVYPVSRKSLSMSGVPADYVSDRMATGQYGCLFDECGYVASSKPACATHLRRKHLGLVLCCPVCSKTYYKHKGWDDHMKQVHPGLPESFYWSPAEDTPSDGARAWISKVARQVVERVMPSSSASEGVPPAKRPRVEESEEVVPSSQGSLPPTPKDDCEVFTIPPGHLRGGARRNIDPETGKDLDTEDAEEPTSSDAPPVVATASRPGLSQGGARRNVDSETGQDLPETTTEEREDLSELL